ncbi:sensor histidine kinase [Paenibacillus gyeongsangnamensis]|nr:histidine kinase [Paenibacillus filicis]
MLQLAFITTLIFTYQIFFAERSGQKSEKIILSVLFGLSILFCMAFPATVTPYYHTDIRIVPLLLGTLYGGPGTGIILSSVIILYLWYMGFNMGLYSSTLALLFSMPVILLFQNSFIKAKKSKRVQIAFMLLLYYSVAGIASVSLVRGLSFMEVVRIDYLHIVINAAALLFFSMLNEMIREMIRKAQDAEIAFLRSQIKPHFLYNTLNSIAALCVKDPGKAEELTLEFAQYLRRSFDFKHLDSLSTLEDELELVQAYLNIEKVRFGAKLNVEYDVDANLDIRIPPLILQPLVENAVRHGLMSNLTGGTVKISIKRIAGAAISLAVEDNGCGMSKGQLAEILQPNGNKKGVGLRNIIQRIKLIYGTSVHIESVEGTGTKIYFDLPR